MSSQKELQLQNIKIAKARYSDIKIQRRYNLFIMEGLNSKKQPCLLIWKGRQKNAYVRYFYQDLLNLNKSKHYYIGLAKSNFEYKKERVIAEPDLKVGDIYYASWGYEQTNVDYYQIVEVVSKHYAMIQSIGSEQVPDSQGHDCCHLLPVKNKFIEGSEPFRKKVGSRIRIDSVRSASKHDGSPNYCSWYY